MAAQPFTTREDFFGRWRHITYSDAATGLDLITLHLSRGEERCSISNIAGSRYDADADLLRVLLAACTEAVAELDRWRGATTRTVGK